MPLKIEIELQDKDLEHFRTLFEQARQSSQGTDEREILAATRGLIEKAVATNPPDFIRERIEGLKDLVDMAEDEAWQLPPDLREPVICALSYFVNPNDLIPDHTPGFGFLDDAIAAELVLRELADEIDSYRQFSSFRIGELNRRKNAGLNTDVSKEDWLADRRAVLHMRLREKLSAGPSRGWSFSVLGMS